MARGMVIIGGEEYGESMELVKCAKKAICKLAETLSEAHMAEREYDEDDDEDYPDMEEQYRRGSRSTMRGGGRMGRRMPRGRFGY